MKTKKIIALALALCMALSVLSIGTVSAGAIEGGWEFSDISASNITADEQAIFEKATTGLGGVAYEPKDVIATQLVSGKNYAFLCTATPATREPVPYWAIVTVYADLKGNAEILNIAKVDPADIKTVENAGDEDSGAWKSEKKENEAPLPESVNTALKDFSGVSYSAIAVLGTQLVAGKNYCILAYGTLVTANPKTYLYEFDVYESLDGKAEVKSIKSFDIKSYVSKPVDEPDPAEKKAQNLKVSAKTKTIKAKALKAKTQKVKAITVKNAKGKLSYKLVKKGSSSKLFKKSSINSKGVITIKKCSVKKKTYSLKVKVSAKATDTYKAASKTVIVKVKIK